MLLEGSREVCSIFQSNPSGTEDTRPDQPVQQEQKRAQDQRFYGTFPFIQNVLYGIQKNERLNN